MSNKIALITGITGQDGSFLAEFLLEKDYEVHGIIRRSSSFNTGRIEHLYIEDYIEDMHNAKNFYVKQLIICIQRYLFHIKSPCTIIHFPQNIVFR